MKDSMLFYSLTADLDATLDLHDGLALPLAFSIKHDSSLYQCWSSEYENCWDYLGLSRTPTKGFWVYQVEYDSEHIEDSSEEWGWLTCGTLRLATADDMGCFHRKESPWIIYP